MDVLVAVPGEFALVLETNTPGMQSRHCVVQRDTSRSWGNPGRQPRISAGRTAG
jgi:hypothetical protein